MCGTVKKHLKIKTNSRFDGPRSEIYTLTTKVKRRLELIKMSFLRSVAGVTL
jgi:hypothetical protein